MIEPVTIINNLVCELHEIIEQKSETKFGRMNPSYMYGCLFGFLSECLSELELTPVQINILINHIKSLDGVKNE